MRAVEPIMVGFGTGTRDQRRRIRRGWQRAVAPPRPRASRVAGELPVDIARLASMGIKVVVKQRGH